eukprot:2159618-Amphidinium_carterae.1
MACWRRPAASTLATSLLHGRAPWARGAESKFGTVMTQHKQELAWPTLCLMACLGSEQFTEL